MPLELLEMVVVGLHPPLMAPMIHRLAYRDNLAQWGSAGSPLLQPARLQEVWFPLQLLVQALLVLMSLRGF